METSVTLQLSRPATVCRSSFPSQQQNCKPSQYDLFSCGARRRGLSNCRSHYEGIFTVETMQTLQLSRSMTARHPRVSILHKMHCGWQTSGPAIGYVSDIWRKNGKQHPEFPVPCVFSSGQEKSPRMMVMFCSSRNRGNAKRSGLSMPEQSSLAPLRDRTGEGKGRKCPELARFVATKVGGSRSEEAPVALAEELKEQLEAWQEEALHVRDRYNSARARFMRLTEVAQQLRHRASIDMDHGNEDSARKVLAEKQKVMHAAGLSQRRAQLLEELSNKLGEAMSKKETQLIAALSSPQARDTATVQVRVVSPKESPKGAFNLDSYQNLETDRVEDPFPIMHDVEEDRRPLAQDSRDVMGKQQSELVNGPNEGYSILGDLSVKEEEMIQTLEDMLQSKAFDSSSELKKDVVGDNKDHGLQGGGHPLLDKKSQCEGSTLVLDSDCEEVSSELETINVAFEAPDADIAVNSQLGSTAIEEAEGQTYNGNSPSSVEEGNKNMDFPKEGISSAGDLLEEASGEVNFYDGRSMLFEDYLQDIDQEVAAVESKLRIFMVTAVRREGDACDERLRMVGEILEQVETLRKRISQTVT